MIVTWLKFVHVVGIAIWCAGLLALPFLYRQRGGLEENPLYRLHVFTRTFYIALISPAAFVAIGSGTALILLQGTYENWFSAKLVGVAALTVIHIFSGLTILKLFEPGKGYPAWRLAVVVLITLCVITAILVLVLGKPAIAWPQELDDLFSPGGLSALFTRLTGVTI